MELEKILDNLKSSLVCAFCKSDLKNPVSARCEHSFCDQCASDACKARHPCPLCNKCAKSRSLKKSSRLKNLVPIVKKLILQSYDILQLVRQGKSEVPLKDLQNTLSPIDCLPASKDIIAKSRGIKTPVKHHRTPEKKSPHLWGRLLSASASSSSSEFEKPQKRSSVLQNVPSEQSARSKVTDWLESNVTQSEVTKQLMNGDLMCDEQSDLSEDLIATSLGNERKENTMTNDILSGNKGEVAAVTTTSEDLVFPKQKPLRTYGGMTNRQNRPIISKFPSITFSDGSHSSSDTELEQSKRVETNGIELDIENSLVPTIFTETDIIKAYDNNDDVSTQKLPSTNDSVPNPTNFYQPALPRVCNDIPVQSQLYNRMSVVDRFSEKPCGYIDLHNPQGSNIVLQHLENALADLPHNTSFQRKGAEQVKSKSQIKKSAETRDIVHLSCDEITVIPDSQQDLKTPKKRRAQTGIRTAPSKVSKSISTRARNSSVNRQTFNDGNRLSDLTQHQRTQTHSSCVSENGLPINVRPGSSERSCLSDGRLAAMRFTYSVTNPEGLPKAFTAAYVKMVRFDAGIGVKEKIETKKSALSKDSYTDKQLSPPKIAKMKGRIVNIDLTQPQQPEADDIICCSWNEPEKASEHSVHEDCSVDSKVATKQSLDCIMEYDDNGGYGCRSNSLKQTNSDASGFSLPMMEPNKKTTKNTIVHALRSVVAIDKDVLSKYFPVSTSLISQAIASCENALTVFEKEVSTLNKIIVPNANCENSAVDSANYNKLVLANGLDHADVSVENMSVHNSSFSSSDSSISAYQSVVPSSIPDDRANTIDMDPPCDPVVAKVESWLNRLSSLDENEGKKQKELLNGRWLRSSSNQGSSSNNLMISESNSGVNEDENSEMININTVSDATVRKLDKTGRLGNLRANNNTGQGSRSSTPLTRRSVRSHVDPDPIMENDNQEDELGLVTSNLNDSDYKYIRAFTSRHNGKHLTTFSPDHVTHVILKAKENRTCDRTLKYLLGIACKKWVVSFKWVIDSLQARRRLDEEEYEITGDACERVHDSEPEALFCGPIRSRLSGSDFNLFESCLFICMPPFSMITIDQAKQLLLYCGATVAQHFDDFDTIKEKHHFKNRLIIVDPDRISDIPGYFLLEQQHEAAVVGIEWMYESISRFEYQPLERYCLANFTQDSRVE